MSSSAAPAPAAATTTTTTTTTSPRSRVVASISTLSPFTAAATAIGGVAIQLADDDVVDDSSDDDGGGGGGDERDVGVSVLAGAGSGRRSDRRDSRLTHALLTTTSTSQVAAVARAVGAR